MEQITINLLATGITPVCHVSQFDDGRTIRINLKKGAEVYTLSGTEEVKMRIRKPDNTERVVDIVNTSSSYVDYVSTPEDCDIEGVNVCELVVGEAGSKNFLMNVEEDAYGGGVDIETLTASGPVATFETNMVDNLVDLKAEITPIQDLHGYDNPWPAGGGKNIACLSADKIDNSQRCNITYVDNNNIVVTATDAFGRAMFVVPCKPDTVYTVSFKGTSTGNYKRIFIAPDNNWSGATAYGTLYLSATEELERSLTFTTVSDATYIYVGFYPTATETSGEMTIKDFMVEKGSAVTSFEPYENICPITGHAEAKIVRTGKNLLSPTLYKGLSYNPTVGTTVTLTESPKQLTDNHDGTFSISTTANLETFCMIVPIKSTTYYRKTVISSNGALGTTEVWLDKNLKVISTYNNTDTTQTKNGLLRIPDNASYFAWVITNRAVANATLTITQPQLELGSAATDYEPYTGTEVTVQFGQTVYKGVLDAKNSKVIAIYAGRAIRTFPWTYNGTEYDFGYFATGNTVDKAYNTNFICECFKSIDKARGSLKNGELAVYNLTNASRRFTIRYDAVSTVEALLEQFGDYLICYELAEPIEIPLSAISQFETLIGINNVYSDIGDVELKYLKQV